MKAKYDLNDYIAVNESIEIMWEDVKVNSRDSVWAARLRADDLINLKNVSAEDVDLDNFVIQQ